MKLGIITDIHEDAERLLIAINSLEKLGCNEIVCLGDISGFDERFYSYRYSKNFSYCLDIIKSNCKIIIPGNHDLYHLSKLPKYNTIFHFPSNWYQLPLQERKNLSKGLIWLYEKDFPINAKEEFSELMSDYYDKYIAEYDGINLLLTHSIAPDYSGFLTKKPIKPNEFGEHLQLLADNNCTIGISGHLHPNGLLRIDGKKSYNPKFTQFELPEGYTMQFICPCIADGMQDNGYTLLDSYNKTIESFPLRTPKYSSFFL